MRSGAPLFLLCAAFDGAGLFWANLLDKCVKLQESGECAGVNATTLPSSFTSTGRLGSTGSVSRPHWMIEGENLRALSELSEPLAESIDLIYLDPPYKTGETDRFYLDSFGSPVEWIAFLAPRLQAAHPLLTRTGVIVISVGDAGLGRVY